MPEGFIGTHQEDRSSTAAILDLQGLKCPLPALRVQKALDKLAPGQLLRVIATDPLSVIDIPHLVQTRGDELVELARGEAGTTFLIRKICSQVNKPTRGG